ncbi:MAG TPA: hypothetical protein VES42_19980 [Pilimelia sp.]|nr:hypothetical protein [Pilimelia sp.]
MVGAIKRVAACREAERAGELAGALAELEDRRLALNSAVYDLMVVASPDVADETVDFYLLCLEAVSRARTGGQGYQPAAFSAARRRLLVRMRTDFGQTALSIKDTPSMAQAGTVE